MMLMLLKWMVFYDQIPILLNIYFLSSNVGEDVQQMGMMILSECVVDVDAVK